MYRHGLGDCLLITLPKTDGTPFYIMIDCGIVVGSPNPSIMEDVVESIIADTNGFVDVLVVTHEHYDHVSGFAIAHDLFAEKRTPGKLAAGQVWFAWTEDPTDRSPTACGRSARSARRNWPRWSPVTAWARVPAWPDHIDNVLGFFGMEKGEEKVEGKAKARARSRPGPAPRWNSSAVSRRCATAARPTSRSRSRTWRACASTCWGRRPRRNSLKKTNSKTEVYHLANMGAAQSFFMTLPGAEGTSWNVTSRSSRRPATRSKT